MLKLSSKVSDKCNKRFGEAVTFTPEIVDALIHRLCLDKKRNENQRTKRHTEKRAGMNTPSNSTATQVSINHFSVNGVTEINIDNRCKLL